MRITFESEAFEEYVTWQKTNKKIAVKINALIRSIQRDGLLSGLGKPEPLKHIKAYSRRIDKTNRLVYVAVEGGILIISCEGHYKD
ncbi:MAG: Txe/YoeB family addiction module toxin [Defluviitaleaceae bacterium]|nr:Txe/YoeB family addiction module toxin [Defluviitaleaceae bacterium]